MKMNIKDEIYFSPKINYSKVGSGGEDQLFDNKKLRISIGNLIKCVKNK